VPTGEVRAERHFARLRCCYRRLDGTGLGRIARGPRSRGASADLTVDPVWRGAAADASVDYVVTRGLGEPVAGL
jgi:hypothetical protein